MLQFATGELILSGAKDEAKKAKLAKITFGGSNPYAGDNHFHLY